MTAEDLYTETARRIAGRVTSVLGFVVLFVIWHPQATRGTSLDEEIKACQRCHAITDWEINDPVTGRVTHLSIEPESYARSSHGSVQCRTCHDWGYGEIPHRGSSEHPIYECVFCHEKDSGLQHYHLSQRKADLRNSVHGSTDSGPMDCHTCHDPHTFRPVNDSDDPLLRIEQSNEICLRCHGSETDSRARFVQKDAAPSHAIFPNYANHLRKVKCVTCHTERIDAAARTRHEILTSDLSLRQCEQCHTPNSTVLDVIYGDWRLSANADSMNSYGPGVESGSNAYVIGSRRSPRLERLSVIGFAATCLAIVLHGLARAVYALRRRGSNGG